MRDRSVHILWHGYTVVLVLAAVLGCKGSSDIEYGHEVEHTRWGEVHRTGPLKHGKKHGVWTTVENGKITKVESWRDGVEHGPSRSWHWSGYSDYMVINGKLHGRYRSFYDDGQIESIEWYKNYKRDGMWCSWWPDGSLEFIRVYEMGRWKTEARDPPGECPVVVAEPRHLDPDDQNYE